MRRPRTNTGGTNGTPLCQPFCRCHPAGPLIANSTFDGDLGGGDGEPQGTAPSLTGVMGTFRGTQTQPGYAVNQILDSYPVTSGAGVPVADLGRQSTANASGQTPGPVTLGPYPVGENTVFVAGTPAAGVLQGDTGVTAALAVGPSNGTITIDADGSFTYTPYLGWCGTDQFTFQISDGDGGTLLQTVFVNVT